MDQPSLEQFATRLAAHLDCTQERACQQIMRTLIETGQPLAPIHLARRLQQMPQESLMAYLTSTDTEFDAQGNIVGWGITLVPTPHHVQIKGRALFTWCAFDTFLFPSLLQIEAHVQSACQTSGQRMTFLVTSDRIVDLTPSTSVVSLILPDARCECARGAFCEQSRFFQTKQAAMPWMAWHPEAILLSVEEAATLGHATSEIASCIRFFTRNKEEVKKKETGKETN